jgi:hypothetical protein
LEDPLVVVIQTEEDEEENFEETQNADSEAQGEGSTKVCFER